MRLVGGSALVVRSRLTLWSGSPINTTITSAFIMASGVLLIPGLWTSIAGTFVALSAIGQILTGSGDPLIELLLGTIGGALALLGPGLWSVDARLFGWKRVEAPPRKASDNACERQAADRRNFLPQK
jgi:hypothetical protein